jgi:uncharacterized damage-inducible protein DinB
MYRHLDDFLASWETESASTLKLLSVLTDASLGQKITPEGRSLGFLAWHITTSVAEMLNRTGLAVDAPEHGPMPAHASEIMSTYEKAARLAADRMKALWTDATLAETRDMYGEPWTIGFTLTALICHQAHHRGQMTVLMRQAGLAVPGMYGPAREEWAAMGMAPME